jgi:hypothetical protein
MRSMEPMTSMSVVAKLRSFKVTGLSEELASILSRNPAPNEVSMVIAHRSHGAATFPHPTRQEDPVTRNSCMPNREPHTILFVAGGALPGDEDGACAVPSEFEKASAWVEEISQQLVRAGIALPRTYVNWTSNEEADACQLYGADIAERLKELKCVYDKSNLFASAYPSLA